MATCRIVSWVHTRNYGTFLGGALLAAGCLALAVTWGRSGEADAPPAGKDPPTAFECRWADTPLTIDGKADEEAWKHAQVIDRFTLPWLGKAARPARTATRARLLWDR